MRILYFSRSFIPSHEANSIHVMNMCEALTELGHEVMLLCPRHSMMTEEMIFDYYGVKSRFKFQYVAYPHIKGRALIYVLSCLKYVLSFRPELVVSRFLYGTFLTTLMGIPTTHDLHDKDWDNGPVSKILFSLILKSKSLKKLSFNSNGLISLFRKKFPALKGGPELQVLHNGSKDFPLTETLKVPGRNELKAGYFGNLYQGRGIELILLIASKLPAIDFIIVGGTEEHIKTWVDLGVSSNVYFIGFVNPKEVYKYRNSIDILLAPYAYTVSMAGNTGNSVEYMNPIKIFEYMSSKKIIISSELKAIREVLSEENSLLIEYSNPEGWVDALRNVSASPQVYANRAEKAYQDFKLHYSWKARAAKMVSQ